MPTEETKKTLNIRPMALLVCFVFLIGLSVAATYLVVRVNYQSQLDNRNQEVLTVQKNNEALTRRVHVKTGERDQVDRHSLEHDLRAQEHHDHVPAGKKTHHADAKQDGAQGEIVVQLYLAHGLLIGLTG